MQECNPSGKLNNDYNTLQGGEDQWRRYMTTASILADTNTQEEDAAMLVVQRRSVSMTAIWALKGFVVSSRPLVEFCD